jgi:CHRD domain
MRGRFLVGLTLGLVAGILVAVPLWVTAGVPAAQGPLFAKLTGAAEVGGGDTDGLGSSSMIAHDGSQICHGINVTNIADPFAAHIHKAPRGVNGPIVVTLVHPTTGDPGASSGCVAADPALVADIFQNPRGYYVNVHNPDFPGGALRGQLRA